MDSLSALRMALPGGMGALGGGDAAVVRGLGGLTAPKMSPADLEKLAEIQPGIARQTDNVPLRSLVVTESGGGSFGTSFNEFVSDVNRKQAAAAESVNSMLAGKNVSLHQTMISLEEASVSFQLMVEVRNKLLESYQELMRMQV